MGWVGLDFTCAFRFWAARLEVDSSRFPPRLPSTDDGASGGSMNMVESCGADDSA